MVTKVPLSMGVTGPYLKLKDMPQGAAAAKALHEDVYQFDVPNEALDGTVEQNLTFVDAVHELMAAVQRLVSKG